MINEIHELIEGPGIALDPAMPLFGGCLGVICYESVVRF